MNSRRSVCFLSVIFACALFGAQPCAAEFDDLIKYLPNETNTLFLINAEKIFQSGLAKEKDFAKRYEKLRNEMPLAMPPDAGKFVLSSTMNVTQMRPESEVAIVELTAPKSIDSVAAATGGSLDEVAGKKCCFVGEICIVQFSDTVFGAMWPTDRQKVSRWIRNIELGNSGKLSNYLLKAVDYTTRVGTEVIIAMDLGDLFSPTLLREAISRSKTLQGKTYDEDAAVELFSSLQGLTLGIRVTDKLNGRLKVEFTEDATLIAPFAGDILLEALGNSGAMIDDFNTWKISVSESEVSLGGVLSESGLRKLLSLLSMDTSSVATLQSTPAVEEPSVFSKEALTARGTRNYFESIKNRLADLESKNKTTTNYQQKLLWLQNYAQGIVRLQTRYVDPDVATAGKAIAENLVDIVYSVQSANERAVQRSNSTVPDAQVTYGGLPRNRVTTPYGRYYRFDPFYSVRVNLKSTADIYQKIVDEEQNTAFKEIEVYEASIRDQLDAMSKIIADKYETQE